MWEVRLFAKFLENADPFQVMKLICWKLQIDFSESPKTRVDIYLKGRGNENEGLKFRGNDTSFVERKVSVETFLGAENLKKEADLLSIPIELIQGPKLVVKKTRWINYSEPFYEATLLELEKTLWVTISIEGVKKEAIPTAKNKIENSIQGLPFESIMFCSYGRWVHLVDG